jgi:3-oxoacyl-[acyl-carrier protein] reductase
MNLQLDGKVALVAAASKGIGLATAKALIDEGCKVSICGRHEGTLADALQELGSNAIVVQADVSKAADIDRWIAESRDRLGPIQILVTNTGGPPAGLVDTLTDEQWQAGFESTLLNVVRMTRLAATDMIQGGWGRIIHVTSLVALEANPLLAISSTLRAGIMNLVRLQSTAYAPNGITVNAVLPGHTLTDRQIHLAEIRAEKSKSTVDQMLEETAKEIPVGRLAEAHEIANAIAFLSSMQSGYITGTNLLVDGGLTKGMA